MQTILGSGGAIGTSLAEVLKEYTGQIRLVSRNPSKVNDSDELFPADLTDAANVLKAVEGSEIAYLTVGLPYKTKIWQAIWPKVMQNVVEACKQHKVKLVFFDNIYMYDPSSLDPIKEDLPVNPSSKKGKVRAEIYRYLMDHAERGEIEALVARAADFYGPGIKQVSMLTEMVLNPLSQGKKANWLGKINCKHSFTYVQDAAKATALLGNTPDAYGEVWHLPTAPNPPTGKEWIEKVAAEMGVKPRYQIAGKTLVSILGFFMPIMKEMKEMLYQYDRDYVFDSSKFESRFPVKPKSYEDGIAEIIKIDYAK